MLLTDHLVSVCQSPLSSLWSGSYSPDHKIEIIRLSGALVAEDRLHVDLFVPSRYASLYLRNVAVHPRVSLMFSHTHTFEAFQVKGDFLSWRPCTPEEVSYQRSYMQGFAENLVSIGLPNGMKIYAYFEEPAIAMRLQAREVYEQTPKSGTGNRIS